MACFLAPVAEAVVTTIIKEGVKRKEEKHIEDKKINKDSKTKTPKNEISFSKKLGWLNNMLWGGSALLAYEHIWHGEVTPWFPFLTAAQNPEETSVMLHEISTVGVSMAVLVTLAWVGMVLVSNYLEKKEKVIQKTQLIK